MSRPLKVLMVEDSADDADLLLRELRRQGFAPASTRVETGESLQAALMAESWDVIISDNNMPLFSGDEALAVVKRLAPDVPFIVVSGTLGEEHAVEAMRAGASDFVIKTRLHRLAPVVERELQESERRAEQRRIASALAESQLQLREAQKLEAVGRLAGGVAHDFNNLLGAIFGYAHLALQELPPDSPHRADIQEIKEATARAAALTRQLLAFSRQQVLDLDVIDLNDVVADSLRLLRRLVGETVVIVAHYEPDLWYIKGDRTQIEQILMNLAMNARDAMPAGGTLVIGTSNAVVPSPGLSPAPPTPGNYVRLDVTDTGVGIPSEQLRKIFEPFFTTKDIGKGTGLGLATVYGIVQQSGGSIFVDSLPGCGTAFTIFLPQTIDAVTVDRPVRAPVEPTGGERILVVEDDPVLRELARRVLTGAGYTVGVAKDPEEAIAHLANKAEPLDLLVTDVMMPGMNGRDLASRLRESRPDLPVIFMSGYAGEVSDRHTLDGDPLLGKPFSPASLVSRVRAVLDRSPA